MEEAATIQQSSQNQVAGGQQDQMTRAEWNTAYSEITRKMQSFPVGDDDKMPTPQADMGIGPVSYDAVFDDACLGKEAIIIADAIAKAQKAFGDIMLKIQASMLAQKFGREDPITWLPAAQRLTIRRDMRLWAATMFKKHGLNDKSPLANILEGLDSRAKRYGGENPATIALIARLAPGDLDMNCSFGTVGYGPIRGYITEVEIASIVRANKIERVRANATKRLIKKLLFGKPDNGAKDTQGDVIKDQGDGSARATEPTQSMAGKSN